MRVLLIEDNRKLSSYIKKVLQRESYVVDQSFDGAMAKDLAFENDYDIIIMDIMLPQIDGVTLCKSFRKDGLNIPILMLTALDTIDNKVSGLDSGADDYLTKPFELVELIARMRALMRRPQDLKEDQLKYKDIIIDLASHRILKANNEITFTVKEYAVLEYLIRNKNRLITREDILEHCWDLSFDSFSNIVDAYIKQVRKKLDDKNAKYIKTIWGLGYKLQE